MNEIMTSEEEDMLSEVESSVQGINGSEEDSDDDGPPNTKRPTLFSASKKFANSCKKRIISVLDSENGEQDASNSPAAEKASLKKAKKGSEIRKPCKVGRKAIWSEDILEDLVSCITEEEEFTKKLIFTNIPNGKKALVYARVLKKVEAQRKERGDYYNFTVEQTRNKFKKLIAICKSAALTMQTSSGIKRFQDEREYGSWFTKLFPLVKSRDSSQPEQAIEPSTFSSSEMPKDDEESTDLAMHPITANIDKSDLFVPIKNGRQARKRKSDKVLSVELLDGLRDILQEHDKTSQMIEFFERDSKAAREHELQLFRIMFSSGQNQNQSSDVHYRSNAAMDRDCASGVFHNPSASRQVCNTFNQSMPKRTSMEGHQLPTSTWQCGNQYECRPFEQSLNINENSKLEDKCYFNL